MEMEGGRCYPSLPLLPFSRLFHYESMMGARMYSLRYSLILPFFLFLHANAMIPHETCSLEWCGERELRLPSQLLVDSCKLAEEVYKLEVLNKKLDYLQAVCLDRKSSEKSCWNGSACSCNDCSSLVDCCISSQKCTSHVLRSAIGISFQRALAFLNGSITKCRLNTQKALMTGMTKEDADVGVLILEEIRLFNQYSPRAVLGNRTKSLISERIRKDMRPVILGDTVKGDGKPLIVFSRKARDLLRLLEMVDGKPLSKQKEVTSLVDGETGKDSTWMYRKDNDDEDKVEQVYPSLPTPIINPQSIPKSMSSVIPLESATTVLPTTVIIPITPEMTTVSIESRNESETFPIPPSMSMDTSPSPSSSTTDPLLDPSAFFNISPSTDSPLRRKERFYDHLKMKMNKKVRFYDLRKIRMGEEVRRAPPRVRLTKEEKEILKSIDVFGMEKEHNKFPYQLSSENEPKKRWNGMDLDLFNAPMLSLSHTPLNEDKKKEEFSLKRIANFQVLPSPIQTKFDSRGKSEIRRAPPKLPTIKDIERIEKEENGKGEEKNIKDHTKKPKILVIRTRTEDESAYSPLDSSPSSFSNQENNHSLPNRIIVPHAVAPPRRNRIHPIPTQRDIPMMNNCTTGSDWCAALSVCLMEATLRQRHALNQMSPCQQHSFILAQNVAIEYGECLMNESCDFNDPECHYSSSLPIIAHCPPFFQECSQLASCCPLTHRCSRQLSLSSSSFSLDASCMLCGQL